MFKLYFEINSYLLQSKIFEILIKLILFFFLLNHRTSNPIFLRFDKIFSRKFIKDVFLIIYIIESPKQLIADVRSIDMKLFGDYLY